MFRETRQVEERERERIGFFVILGPESRKIKIVINGFVVRMKVNKKKEINFVKFDNKN